MKSKTKLFLLPIMAVALFAFAFAGVEAFKTTPAKVAADTTKTVYYYNVNDWANPRAHAWNNTEETEWPGAVGVAATSVGPKWFSFEIPEYATGICFSDNGANQTYDLTIEGQYYYNGEWYDATTTTVHFYNADSWTNVYAHAWNVIDYNQFDDTSWGSDAQMTFEGDGWYSLVVNTFVGFEKWFIFKDAAGDTSNRTGNLQMASGKPNFYKGLWLANKSNVSTVGYYVAGTINGADCRATTNYKCLTDSSYTDGNVAALRGLRMKKDDSVYVVYGTGSTATGTTIEYKNGSGYLESIDNDGTYSVFLYNSDGYKVSCAEVTSQEVAMTSTYYKKSTDSNYLLLATGFDFANLTRETFSNYSLAYYINGEKHDLPKYYSGITLGENVYEPVNIFGATGFTTDKIMAYEIGDGTGALTGNTYTVQAVVMYDGAVISFSPYVIHTVA